MVSAGVVGSFPVTSRVKGNLCSMQASAATAGTQLLQREIMSKQTRADGNSWLCFLLVLAIVRPLGSMQ